MTSHQLALLQQKLHPKTPDCERLREFEDRYRQILKRSYDKHHGVRDLSPIGQELWIIVL